MSTKFIKHEVVVDISRWYIDAHCEIHVYMAQGPSHMCGRTGAALLHYGNRRQVYRLSQWVAGSLVYVHMGVNMLIVVGILSADILSYVDYVHRSKYRNRARG